MKRSFSRAYTVVELMMSLAVFATGVTGIIAMQRATVTSNQMAKNMTLANAIAQSWLTRLEADATLWRNNLTGTVWLQSVDVANLNNAWQLPAYDAALAFGPEFDALGAPVAANGEFCAQIRLTWLYRDQNGGGIRGNGVIRSEVRVFWPRSGQTRIAADCTDGTAATITAVSAATNTYHFVVHAGAVRQPGFGP
jgi:hypothetical protein